MERCVNVRVHGAMEIRFCMNAVSTAKYTILSFVGKFLIEQFSKYANIFFLFTSIIQQIDGVSPTSRFATLIPLCFVLIVSACKEILEDRRRHTQDR